MQGLELAERYWNEVGRPALAVACPEAAERWSAGLVGEGSDCFGFDDDISRDHDWGPGFCVWLDGPDYERFGARLQRAYGQLPETFLGLRRDVQPEGRGRVGVLRTEEFYARFTGLPHPPQTVGEWLSLDDEALAVCANGKLFEDRAPGFSAYRAELLRFYPRDILLKKLAAHCALAGQAGQYHYARCVQRGDAAAAFLALARFIEHGQAVCFMANRRYRPYFKWANRALRELPIAGEEMAARFERIASGQVLDQRDAVEDACAALVRALQAGRLCPEGVRPGDFLMDCGREIQCAVHNDRLRSLPLLTLTVTM